jgi:23S rRNA (pseudouridine1915-N3)-methyltransferase
MDEEARRLLEVAAGARIVMLDARGKGQTSEAFAAELRRARDGGVEAIAFLIGGADGHGEAVRAAASQTLSLGAMTLPHGLARVVLAEQLYRAATIIAGHPYHRA